MADNFVGIETDRTPLADGVGWFEIKRNLNIFDQRRMETTALVPFIDDGKVYNRVDWSLYEILRAEIWLTDWLMLDKSNKPVKLSLDAIKNLKPEVFEEISTVILHRIDEIDAEKKARDLAKVQTSTLTEPTS